MGVCDAVLSSRPIKWPKSSLSRLPRSPLVWRMFKPAVFAWLGGLIIHVNWDPMPIIKTLMAI